MALVRVRASYSILARARVVVRVRVLVRVRDGVLFRVLLLVIGFRPT